MHTHLSLAFEVDTHYTLSNGKRTHLSLALEVYAHYTLSNGVHTTPWHSKLDTHYTLLSNGKRTHLSPTLDPRHSLPKPLVDGLHESLHALLPRVLQARELFHYQNKMTVLSARPPPTHPISPWG